MLDIFLHQWQETLHHQYPEDVTDESRSFLNNLGPRPEIIIVSGELIEQHYVQKIHEIADPIADINIQYHPGEEYYALKNIGGGAAKGDIICFLDSDVIPEPGWLAYIFGSFSAPEIDVVAGQAYVDPVSTYAKAFAVGWIFDMVDEERKLRKTNRFFSNSLALRSHIFHAHPFPPMGKRTRGATSKYQEVLQRHQIAAWENRKALLKHPPPSNLKHLIIRAIAHGRDYYMKNSQKRSLEGLQISQKTALHRLKKGLRNTFKHGDRVGLKPLETIPVFFILSTYYLFFSIGGILSHISPTIMGNHFRI